MDTFLVYLGLTLVAVSSGYFGWIYREWHEETKERRWWAELDERPTETPYDWANEDEVA